MTASQPDAELSELLDAAERLEPGTVCVVGLGYVGLPLAVAFDRAGHSVVGYDIDARKIERLATGTDVTGDLGDGAIRESEVTFTTDAAGIAAADYIIITVPTPLDVDGDPDLGAIEAAARTVGEHLTPGTTVVLESTVYPGATREVLVPILEASSGLTCGEDFAVGYSPERASPGDTEHGLGDVVKIVGGDDDAVRDVLADLYGGIVGAGIYEAPSIEVAEAAKVFENVQRDVNIALVNEFAVVCDHLDIDVHEVLEAAGTKWNFHDEYRPGLVGGHCIPIDPHYLAHRSARAGFTPELILAGRRVNEAMPQYVAEQVLKALNRCGKVLAESRVLVLGVTYKPNVGDVRHSKVADIVSELREYDVDVQGYDPHADPDVVRESLGVELLPRLRFDGYDGVVLATPHREFHDLDLRTVAAALDGPPLLVDVASLFDGDQARDAGFDYRRL